MNIWFSFLRLLYQYTSMMNSSVAKHDTRLADEQYPITMGQMRNCRRAWLNADCRVLSGGNRTIIECNMAAVFPHHWSETI